MLVLSVGYPLFPVTSDSAGGAEQILRLVEKGVVQAGHASLVIAPEGSQVQGTLIATERGAPEMNDEDRIRAQQEHERLIAATLEQHHVDVIHFHGLDFQAYLPRQDVSMVATLHLPAAWYQPEVFYLRGIHLVCVSKDQASTLTTTSNVTVIENGIDPIGTDPAGTRGEDLLWLGRICPEKGTVLALRVAHRLACPLTIAGPVHGFAYHRDYFRKEVEPLLDERRHYIGPVGLQTKINLLRQAKALLIPSLAPETSSLVAMEAISAGTPVIAFASGALPEVVEDGITGFIVHSEEEMAEAVGRVSELHWEGERHPATRMVSQYLKLYERLIRTRHLGT